MSPASGAQGEDRDGSSRFLWGDGVREETCVIGFPEERRTDLEQTFEMAARLRDMGVDDFWFSCAVPYLGTRLYEPYREIRPDVNLDGLMESFSTHEANMDTVDFSASQIKELRNRAMALLNSSGRSPVRSEEFFEGIG